MFYIIRVTSAVLGNYRSRSRRAAEKKKSRFVSEVKPQKRGVTRRDSVGCAAPVGTPAMPWMTRAYARQRARGLRGKRRTLRRCRCNRSPVACADFSAPRRFQRRHHHDPAPPPHPPHRRCPNRRSGRSPLRLHTHQHPHPARCSRSRPRHLRLESKEKGVTRNTYTRRRERRRGWQRVAEGGRLVSSRKAFGMREVLY